MANKHRVVKWLGVALTTGYIAIAASAEPVAIVTDVRGDARRTDGGAVGVLADLPAGSRIVLQASARLSVVHLPSQTTFELTGPGGFAIDANGVQAAAGTAAPSRKPLAAVYRDVRLRPASVTQASIAMRGDSHDPRLRLVSPVASWLIERPSAFRWEAQAPAVRYSFQLTDSNGHVLHESVTEQTAVSIPAGIRFEPGRTYGWEVKATLGDGKVIEAWTEIGIASALLRDKVENARPVAAAGFADRVAYALLLESLSVREAARAEWAAISQERPDEARLRALAEGR